MQRSVETVRNESLQLIKSRLFCPYEFDKNFARRKEQKVEIYFRISFIVTWIEETI